MSRFTAETYQNEFLPIGGEEVNAVVTVTADEAAGPASGTSDAAEIVIIDTSGSMGLPGAKLRAAVHATGVAIDTIRDGVAFGVIAGTHRATAVYPRRGLVTASATTRAARASAGTVTTGEAVASGSTTTRAVPPAPDGRRACASRTSTWARAAALVASKPTASSFAASDPARWSSWRASSS